jgi:hypothetical protein
MSLRSSTIVSAASLRSPGTSSGTSTARVSPARWTRGSPPEGTATSFFFASVRSRAIAASMSRRLAPSSSASSAAAPSRSTPGKLPRSRSTLAEPEPGEPNPPLVRCSVCLAANGRAARSVTSQTIATSLRRRSTKSESLSIVRCIASLPPCRIGWLARILPEAVGRSCELPHFE